MAFPLGRLTHCLSGSRARTWRMVLTEDCHLESGGPLCRFASHNFFVLEPDVGRRHCRVDRSRTSPSIPDLWGYRSFVLKVSQGTRFRTSCPRPIGVPHTPPAWFSVPSLLLRGIHLAISRRTDRLVQATQLRDRDGSIVTTGGCPSEFHAYWNRWWYPVLDEAGNLMFGRVRTTKVTSLR